MGRLWGVDSQRWFRVSVFDTCGYRYKMCVGDMKKCASPFFCIAPDFHYICIAKNDIYSMI